MGCSGWASIGLLGLRMVSRIGLLWLSMDRAEKGFKGTAVRVEKGLRERSIRVGQAYCC